LLRSISSSLLAVTRRGYLVEEALFSTGLFDCSLNVLWEMQVRLPFGRHCLLNTPADGARRSRKRNLNQNRAMSEMPPTISTAPRIRHTLIEVLRKAREGGSDTALIVMTAQGDSTTAINAMKLGAFDYIAKPVNVDKLLPQLHRAIEHRKQARDAAKASANMQAVAKAPAMVGHSPAMQHVYKLIG
jgi:hypothetical protein